MLVSLHRSRFVGRIAMVPTLAAMVVPAANAEIRSDAFDRTPSAPATDLRSPDTVDSALASEAARIHVDLDLRSPDTRDAATRLSSREPLVVAAARSSGFEWLDAGIGAGVSLALVLLALTTRQLVIGQRRSDSDRARASA